MFALSNNLKRYFGSSAPSTGAAASDDDGFGPPLDDGRDEPFPWAHDDDLSALLGDTVLDETLDPATAPALVEREIPEDEQPIPAQPIANATKAIKIARLPRPLKQGGEALLETIANVHAQPLCGKC